MNAPKIDWHRVEWRKHADPKCRDCEGTGESVEKMRSFSISSVCWCVDVKRIVAEHDAAHGEVKHGG